jgi:hypothetical protein
MNTAERIGNFRTGRGDNSSPESRKTGAEQPSTGLLLLGGMLGVVCSGFFSLLLGWVAKLPPSGLSPRPPHLAL